MPLKPKKGAKGKDAAKPSDRRSASEAHDGHPQTPSTRAVSQESTIAAVGPAPTGSSAPSAGVSHQRGEAPTSTSAAADIAAVANEAFAEVVLDLDSIDQQQEDDVNRQLSALLSRGEFEKRLREIVRRRRHCRERPSNGRFNQGDDQIGEAGSGDATEGIDDDKVDFELDTETAYLGDFLESDHISRTVNEILWGGEGSDAGNLFLTLEEIEELEHAEHEELDFQYFNSEDICSPTIRDYIRPHSEPPIVRGELEPGATWRSFVASLPSPTENADVNALIGTERISRLMRFIADKPELLATDLGIMAALDVFSEAVTSPAGLAPPLEAYHYTSLLKQLFVQMNWTIAQVSNSVHLQQDSPDVSPLRLPSELPKSSPAALPSILTSHLKQDANVLSYPYYFLGLHLPHASFSSVSTRLRKFFSRPSKSPDSQAFHRELVEDVIMTGFVNLVASTRAVNLFMKAQERVVDFLNSRQRTAFPEGQFTVAVSSPYTITSNPDEFKLSWPSGAAALLAVIEGVSCGAYNIQTRSLMGKEAMSERRPPLDEEGLTKVLEALAATVESVGKTCLKKHATEAFDQIQEGPEQDTVSELIAGHAHTASFRELADYLLRAASDIDSDECGRLLWSILGIQEKFHPAPHSESCAHRRMSENEDAGDLVCDCPAGFVEKVNTIIAHLTAAVYVPLTLAASLGTPALAVLNLLTGAAVPTEEGLVCFGRRPLNEQVAGSTDDTLHCGSIYSDVPRLSKLFETLSKPTLVLGRLRYTTNSMMAIGWPDRVGTKLFGGTKPARTSETAAPSPTATGSTTSGARFAVEPIIEASDESSIKARLVATSELGMLWGHTLREERTLLRSYLSDLPESLLLWPLPPYQPALLQVFSILTSASTETRTSEAASDSYDLAVLGVPNLFQAIDIDLGKVTCAELVPPENAASPLVYPEAVPSYSALLVPDDERVLIAEDALGLPAGPMFGAYQPYPSGELEKLAVTDSTFSVETKFDPLNYFAAGRVWQKQRMRLRLLRMMQANSDYDELRASLETPTLDQRGTSDDHTATSLYKHVLPESVSLATPPETHTHADPPSQLSVESLPPTRGPAQASQQAPPAAAQPRLAQMLYKLAAIPGAFAPLRVAGYAPAPTPMEVYMDLQGTGLPVDNLGKNEATLGPSSLGLSTHAESESRTGGAHPPNQQSQQHQTQSSSKSKGKGGKQQQQAQSKGSNQGLTAESKASSNDSDKTKQRNALQTINLPETRVPSHMGYGSAYTANLICSLRSIPKALRSKPGLGQSIKQFGSIDRYSGPEIEQVLDDAYVGTQDSGVSFEVDSPEIAEVLRQERLERAVFRAYQARNTYPHELPSYIAAKRTNSIPASSEHMSEGSTLAEQNTTQVATEADVDGLAKLFETVLREQINESSRFTQKMDRDLHRSLYKSFISSLPQDMVREGGSTDASSSGAAESSTSPVPSYMSASSSNSLAETRVDHPAKSWTSPTLNVISTTISPLVPTGPTGALPGYNQSPWPSSTDTAGRDKTQNLDVTLVEHAKLALNASVIADANLMHQAVPTTVLPFSVSGNRWIANAGNAIASEHPAAAVDEAAALAALTTEMDSRYSSTGQVPETLAWRVIEAEANRPLLVGREKADVLDRRAESWLQSFTPSSDTLLQAAQVAQANSESSEAVAFTPEQSAFALRIGSLWLVQKPHVGVSDGTDLYGSVVPRSALEDYVKTLSKHPDGVTPETVDAHVYTASSITTEEWTEKVVAKLLGASDPEAHASGSRDTDAQLAELQEGKHDLKVGSETSASKLEAKESSKDAKKESKKEKKEKKTGKLESESKPSQSSTTSAQRDSQTSDALHGAFQEGSWLPAGVIPDDLSQLLRLSLGLDPQGSEKHDDESFSTDLPTLYPPGSKAYELIHTTPHRVSVPPAPGPLSLVGWVPEPAQPTLALGSSASSSQSNQQAAGHTAAGGASSNMGEIAGAPSLLCSEEDADEIRALERIETCIPLLSSNRQELQDIGATNLRVILTSPQMSLIDEVVDAGVIPRLVKLLSSNPNPKLQFEAVWTLTNVASGSSNHVRTLIERGAIPQFVAMLQSEHEDVVEQATWALGNLAGDSIAARDAVLAAKPLVHMYVLCSRPTTRVSLQRNLSWAISNLCRGKPAPPFECISAALAALRLLLKSSDPEVLKDTCWGLSYLVDESYNQSMSGQPTASSTSGMDASQQSTIATTEQSGDELTSWSEPFAGNAIDLLIAHGVDKEVVKLLSHPHEQVQTAALRIIANIVTGTDHQTDAIISNGALEALKHLLVHSNPLIRKETCWTVSNILAGTAAHVKAVADAGLLDPLFALLLSDDVEVQKEATWALSNATSGGPEVVDTLVRLGVLEPMIEMAAMHDAQIASVVIEGVENIFRFGWRRYAHSTVKTQNATGLSLIPCVNIYAESLRRSSAIMMLQQAAQALAETHPSVAQRMTLLIARNFIVDAPGWDERTAMQFPMITAEEIKQYIVSEATRNKVLAALTARNGEKSSDPQADAFVASLRKEELRQLVGDNRWSDVMYSVVSALGFILSVSVTNSTNRQAIEAEVTSLEAVSTEGSSVEGSSVEGSSVEGSSVEGSLAKGVSATDEVTHNANTEEAASELTAASSTTATSGDDEFKQAPKQAPRWEITRKTMEAIGRMAKVVNTILGKAKTVTELEQLGQHASRSGDSTSVRREEHEEETLATEIWANNEFHSAYFDVLESLAAEAPEMAKLLLHAVQNPRSGHPLYSSSVGIEFDTLQSSDHSLSAATPSNTTETTSDASSTCEGSRVESPSTTTPSPASKSGGAKQK